MRSFSALISGIAFMVATVSALPAAKELSVNNKMFTGNPFEVTELIVDRVKAGNVSMIFTVYDPDPLANKTVDCPGSWAYGSSGWPTGTYQSCLNSTFGWHMKDFVSWTEFSLELKDTFTDPSVGPPPYDKVTIFGVAEFTDDVMHCEQFDEGTETCLQKGGSVVRAPIDRSIA